MPDPIPEGYLKADILTNETRHTRRTLLAVSFISIVLTLAPLTVKQAAAGGLKLEGLTEGVLSGILFLIIVWHPLTVWAGARFRRPPRVH